MNYDNMILKNYTTGNVWNQMGKCGCSYLRSTFSLNTMKHAAHSGSQSGSAYWL